MLTWAQLVAGLWVMLSPWLLGFSSILVLRWSNLVAGLLIVLLSLWGIFGKERV